MLDYAEEILKQTDGLSSRRSDYLNRINKLRDENIASLKTLFDLPVEIAANLDRDAYNCCNLADVTVEELIDSVKMSRSLALKIITKAREIERSPSIREIKRSPSAKISVILSRDTSRISTGSIQLDNLLGGGVFTKSITEFFGGEGCGKTLLTLALSVIAQFTLERGGLRKSNTPVKVQVFDREGHFRSACKLITSICTRFGLEIEQIEEIKENITVERVHDTNELVERVDHFINSTEGDNHGLLIIDSFSGTFLENEKITSNRCAIEDALMDKLVRITEDREIAVVLTNHVGRNIPVFVEEIPVPATCERAERKVTTRVLLKRRKGNVISALIDKSSSLPRRDAIFRISEEGVSDL